MDEVFLAIAALLVGVLILVLPVVTFVRTLRIRKLEGRIAGLEAALLRLMREREAPAAPQPPPEPELKPRPEPVEAAPPPPPPQPIAQPAVPARKWEEVIGERWLGWVGISVLLFGAAFGLKFAFENRWIGELGRVLLGVAGGVGFVAFGRKQHRLERRWFSQAMTAGGVTLMYLSVYAAYGFYQLIDPTAAFVFLVLIVVQAHLLAVGYNAPGIALMGQIGGFLTPILLSTGHDSYGILFSFILLLDAGVVLVTLMRGWRWISSVSFVLTHVMFWAWWDANYHPEKLWAAIAFQTAVFALFVIADLVPRRRGRPLSAENWIRLFLNPFIFFATAYSLLESNYPEWMGTFAVAMAAAYAALAKASPSRLRLALVAVAGVFTTLAIPIQLESHWITLAWGLQACALAWLAVRERSDWFQRAMVGVFACAFVHYLSEVPWDYRAAFTPIINRDFASAVALAACLLYAAFRLKDGARRLALGLGLSAAAVAWLASTIEAYSYFDVLLREIPDPSGAERRALRWSGQMTVSMIWSIYSAALIGLGLARKVVALRWAGLGLFGVTVLKAFFVDITVLEGGYRVIALFVLGALLLGAGWAYQRVSKEPEKP